jgi:hypothetical protein
MAGWGSDGLHGCCYTTGSGILNTNDWDDFLAAIILIAFSAASGEIANGIFFFVNVAFPNG